MLRERGTVALVVTLALGLLLAACGPESPTPPVGPSDDQAGEPVEQMEFVGVVDSIGEDEWRIGDLAVTILRNTQIEDGIELGATVRVHAALTDAGKLAAKEIELEAPAPEGGYEPTPLPADQDTRSQPAGFASALRDH